MKKKTRRKKILYNNSTRCKSIQERKKKVLVMNIVNMEEVVAKDEVEVMDVNEKASIKMKIEENTQPVVMSGATQE